MVYQWSFKLDSKVFERNPKEISVSNVFQGCFKEVTRVFQEIFKNVSSKVEGVLKEFKTLPRKIK